jgi:hypothetical protein
MNAVTPASAKGLSLMTTSTHGRNRPGGHGVARWQGVFNLVSGLWPLVSMRTFEAVYGPKVDRWLVHTVAGLLVTVGAAQATAHTDQEVRLARIIGVGTATTLLTVDVINVPRGRIRWTYLQDALCEAAWLAAWWRSGHRRG